MLNELAAELERFKKEAMDDQYSQGTSAALNMFGLRYAAMLESKSINELGIIAQTAGYTFSMGQELRKMVKLWKGYNAQIRGL